MPILFIREDITRMETDAIVNAANTALRGGGGVDGAIHEAAGPQLAEACKKLGGCPTGEARITDGFNLPARYIIHTPGPIWQGGTHGEQELLAACYRNSLELAVKYQCTSIAFPVISSGAYGFPADKALKIAVDTISSYDGIDDLTVYLTVFGRQVFEVSDRLYSDVRRIVDDQYVQETETRYSRNRPSFRPRFDKHAQGKANETVPEVMQCESARPEEELSDSMPFAAVGSDDAHGSLNEDELNELLRKQDAGFSETLIRLIDERGMTDPECYKRANMDRRHFNHIKNDKTYHPKKETVLALAVALRLNTAETEDLLNRAGFTLSRYDTRDKAMRYFISHRCFDINMINLMLFNYDLPLLG